MTTLLCLAGLLAQMASSADRSEVRSADIAIGAHVRAQSLVFESVPQIEVRFRGPASNRSLHRTDRTNLPESVEPYVVYRDIGVLLTITSTLPDIEKIVDEALGEPADEVGAVESER